MAGGKRALAEELALDRRRKWLEANKGAIAACNDSVEKSGVFSDGRRILSRRVSEFVGIRVRRIMDDGLWIPDWQPGPVRPVLDDEVCHVWRVDLEQVVVRLAGDGVPVDGDLGPGASSLSAEELDRRARFVFERHRRWFLAARTALRGVLGAYLGLDAAAVPIVAPLHGRPTLAAGAQASGGPLDFNLSHSDALALIAVTRRAPLGVDVELVRPMNDALALAQRHYVGDEIARVAAVEGAARDRAFFTCWTRKEAVLKSTGAGLSVAPSTIRVGATPEPLRLVFEDPAGAEALRVVSFAVRADALGACAVAPRVRVEGMFDYGT